MRPEVAFIGINYNDVLLLFTRRENGWVADVYQKSVKMPTYLLAMVICDFQYKEKYTSNGKVRVRSLIWYKPENKIDLQGPLKVV